ncbi:MAG: zf-HC2 domain-containing protein [Candidatus Scalindua sp.]
MTTCNEAIEQLHEFLDNELDEGNHSTIKQHIEMCHKCCEKFEFEQAIKKIIKDKTPLHKTPQHLLQSIVSQLADLNAASDTSWGSSQVGLPTESDLEPANRVASGDGREEHNHTETPTLELKRWRIRGIFGFFTLRPAFVTMAILLPITIIGLAAYLSFFRPVEYPPIVQVAAERHDSFVHDNMHLDLVSSDRNEIRRHFKNLQRSNLAIYVPECNGREMKLLGCKNSSFAGRKSAYVGLSGNHNKISLEMVNGSDMNLNKLNHEIFKGRSYYFGRYKGYNVVLWRQGKTLYSMTSIMNRRDLMRVASESIRSYNK